MVNYRTATWPTGRTNEIRFSKWGSLKAMRQWLISEAVINKDDWDRLVDGEEIARADFPDYMIALAHTRDHYFPCFYYGK